MTETLRQALVVLHPFRGYKKGDVIADAKVAAEIRISVFSSNFVVTSVPAAIVSSGDAQ